MKISEDNIITALKNSIVFKELGENEIKDMLNFINYRIQEYDKGETVAIEEDDCNSLGIVINGKIEPQKIFPSGKAITIDRLEMGNAFGEAIIFSNVHKYPATIVCIEKAAVMMISKNEMLKLFSHNNKILNNFIAVLSNKILMLNRRVKTLSYQSIRQKICSYLLYIYQNQKTKVIKLPISRKEMAEYLGIPRPSLSREMINMQDEGLIEFDKNIIKIIDVESLSDILSE
ncbi:Crp/Fnr family transcriptional regulator [Clostridium sp. MSJ-11]|uniref:Crp/Fnr family transcriptional regulator n=1 Tax=Clostridium mobile TaxID=2841512 RepID=A0ABS6EDU5_9CLOT|nr:Crp/Fnr family transcriptional regulator [Clostridium mobile]MBU5483376.1 Crp/Fnr family transcriptional regulator [Clostridium mobile]